MSEKKPTVAQLLKRVEELEGRIAELEARPPEQHTHFHYAPQPSIPNWPSGPYTVPYCGPNTRGPAQPIPPSGLEKVPLLPYGAHCTG